MHLSFTGKVTLTQLVVQAIVVFSMQTAKLPIRIISKIEQVCGRFVWVAQKSITNCAWGLGLKNLEEINSALLMKIGCGLVLDHSSF